MCRQTKTNWVYINSKDTYTVYHLFVTCVCLHVVCIYMHICTHVGACVYMCIFVHVWVHVCMCTFAHMWVHVFTGTYMHEWKSKVQLVPGSLVYAFGVWNYRQLPPHLLCFDVGSREKHWAISPAPFTDLSGLKFYCSDGNKYESI